MDLLPRVKSLEGAAAGGTTAAGPPSVGAGGTPSFGSLRRLNPLAVLLPEDLAKVRAR
jgi:hypothetical protein